VAQWGDNQHQQLAGFLQMHNDDILDNALNYAKQHYPQAAPQQWAAFANSVYYLMTGWSGGYGGPSLREHIINHLYSVSSGNYLTWDNAVSKCADICFAPPEQLKDYFKQMRDLDLPHFDDLAADLEALD